MRDVFPNVPMFTGNGGVYTNGHAKSLWRLWQARDALAAPADPAPAEPDALGVVACGPHTPAEHSDAIGRRVREVWIEWAKQQPSPKPSWLVPYDDLSEADKDADRRIGEALWLEGFREAQQIAKSVLYPPAALEAVAREAVRLARTGEVAIGPGTFALTEAEIVQAALAAGRIA